MSFSTVIGYLKDVEEPLTTFRKILGLLGVTKMVDFEVYDMTNDKELGKGRTEVENIKDLTKPDLWITIKGKGFEITARNTCGEFGIEITKKEVLQQVVKELMKQPRVKGCTLHIHKAGITETRKFEEYMK